jgi:hypothetical protein
MPGMLCGMFDHVEDRPSKRHGVTKPGDGRSVEVDLADRFVASDACPREERKHAVGGVDGIEFHVVARLKPPRAGGPSEDFAQPVALGGCHVLDQSEQAHPAGGHGLAELVVGEAVDLPEDYIALLVEKGRQYLPFAAGSLSGHRELISLFRFSAFEGGEEARDEGPSQAARRDLGLSDTGCPTDRTLSAVSEATGRLQRRVVQPRAKANLRADELRDSSLPLAIRAFIFPRQLWSTSPSLSLDSSLVNPSDALSNSLLCQYTFSEPEANIADADAANLRLVLPWGGRHTSNNKVVDTLDASAAKPAVGLTIRCLF